MSGVEASYNVELISSVISILKVTKNLYDAARDTRGQPVAFREVAARLPRVIETLDRLIVRAQAEALDEPTKETLKTILEPCHSNVKKLHKIFLDVVPEDADKKYIRYKKALSGLGKRKKVEYLMEEILRDTQFIRSRMIGIATDEQMKEMDEAFKQIRGMAFSRQGETRPIRHPLNVPSVDIDHENVASEDEDVDIDRYTLIARVKGLDREVDELLATVDTGSHSNFISRPALDKLSNVKKHPIPSPKAYASFYGEDLIPLHFVRLQLEFYRLRLSVEVELKILDIPQISGAQVILGRRFIRNNGGVQLLERIVAANKVSPTTILSSAASPPVSLAATGATKHIVTNSNALVSNADAVKSSHLTQLQIPGPLNIPFKSATAETLTAKASDPAGSDLESFNSQSIFSTVLASDSSRSSAGVARDLLDEIFLLLRDDEVLHPLYPIVFEKAGVKVFQRLFNRLMKTYCHSLKEEASNAEEIEVANFIRKRLRSLAIKLLEEFAPKDHQKPNLEPLRVRSDHRRRKRVFNYLEQNFGDNLPDVVAAEESSDDSDSNSTILVFEHLIDFLTAGEPWSKFQAEFGHEVRLIGSERSPTSIERLLAFGSNQASKITSTLQRCLSLERCVLLPGKVRIEWACRCGYMSFDDYEELEVGGVAQLAQELINSSAIVRADVVSTAKGRIAEFITSAQNSLTQFNRHFKRGSTAQPLPTSRALSTAVELSQLQQPNQDPRYLLLCANSNTRRKVPSFEHIDLCTTKSDQQLFTQLKGIYRRRVKESRIYKAQLRNIYFIEVSLLSKQSYT